MIGVVIERGEGSFIVCCVCGYGVVGVVVGVVWYILMIE